jgi:hypothetical protein
MSKAETVNDALHLDTTEKLSTKNDERPLMRCGSCGTKVALEPGDVIFGGQWYHVNCWQNERRVSTESGEEIEVLLLEEHKDYLKL